MNYSKSLLHIVIEPIKEYLFDANVQEIMVNHTGLIIVEQANQLYETSKYLSAEEIETMIRVVANDNGIYVTNENPTFSSSIDGIECRFQGLLPPVSSTPIFCIRKQNTNYKTITDLVAHKMLSASQATVLRNALLRKKNILIAGSTGSGKTTLANALVQELVNLGERIIVIEDTPELNISEKSNVRLLIKNNYTYSKAIFDVLRMRPDRIILGELRDGSALDLLKAWNTGHGGGISTIHANNAKLALTRLIQLVEEVAAHPSLDFIAEVVDYCVFVERDKKERKVKSIIKVHSYNAGTNKFITEELL